MKKYLVLLFVIIATLSFGQNDYQDVVYLKNGSIIRGVIIERIPNKSIKIETTDRNIFVFEMDEIEKFTKEPYQDKEVNTQDNSNSFQEDKRRNSAKNSSNRSVYNSIIELGYQKGIGDYGMSRVKLDFVSSFRLNPYFALGFGAGLRYYFDGDLLTPYYADIRVYFMDNKVTPYLSLAAGYSFNFSDFERGGFLFSPKVGVSFKVSDGFALNLGFGYEMQRMTIYKPSNYGANFSSTENSGALSFIIGFSF